MSNFVCLSTERDPYPSLAGQPHISPVAPPDNIVASSSVHLLCTYDIKDPGPFHVSYKVTWFKIMHFLGGKTGKMVLLFKTTEEKAVVIGFGSADFHLGDTVSTADTDVVVYNFCSKQIHIEKERKLSNTHRSLTINNIIIICLFLDCV